MNKYQEALNDIVDNGVSIEYFNKQAIKEESDNSILIIQQLIDKLPYWLELEDEDDDVIRLEDKVFLYGKEFYVTHIDDEEHFSFPYKLSVYKEDVGLNADDLEGKYGWETSEWALSDFDSLTKVKIK